MTDLPGNIAAEETRPPEDSMPPARNAPAGPLIRALQLIILLVVITTALAHPLCLDDARLQSLYDWLGAPKFFQQLLPWISCGFSPLVLKEAFLQTLIIPLLFVFVWLKIRGQWLGLESSAFQGKNRGWRAVIRQPGVWAAAFLGYSALTIAWSPVFQQSLRTWLLMACGVAVMFITKSQLTSRGFIVKFMTGVTAVGAVLAGCALLQHLDLAPWLPHSSDPRNRMSSLIGHNTGLSSWLLFPLSYCIYFGLVNRRLIVRFVAWLLVGLFALVIVAAESRAIWVLGLAIIVVLPWKIVQLVRFRFRGWIVAGGTVIAAGVIAALSIAPQSNPLARLPVSLGERVTGHILNLDQLRRETRLRILVVSLTEIFPRAPLHGTGIGSFEWVYPKAQGDYFSNHPESRLGTTTRRTDLAHNDYLQVLCETGLIGLGLLLAGMAALAFQIRRSYRELIIPQNRAMCWSLSTPAAAVCAHAVVDFPFHVAPIALLAALSAAMASEMRDKADLDEVPCQIASNDGSPARATLIAFGITVVLFSRTPYAWSQLVGREIVSDAYYNSGMDWLNRYYASVGQTSQRDLSTLGRAQRTFREAVVTNVFNGLAYEGQATAAVNRAAVALRMYEHLPAEDRTTSVGQFLRANIQRDSDSAITIIENQMASGELRYHFTWYLLGRAWRMQWELEKRTAMAPEDSEAYREAVKAQRMAVYYNPADAVALRELSDLLSESEKMAEEGRLILGALFKIDPWSADDLLLKPAVELARIGEIETARMMLEPFIANFAREPRVELAAAWLAYYSAVWPPVALDDVKRREDYLTWRREQLSTATAMLERVPEEKPFREDKHRLELLFAAAKGDAARARTLAAERLAEWPFDNEAKVISYWAEKALYGGGLKFEDSVEFYRTKGLLCAEFLEPREFAFSLAELATRPGEKLTQQEARRLARFAVANEWWDFLRKVLPVFRGTYPGDEMLADIEERVPAVEGAEN